MTLVRRGQPLYRSAQEQRTDCDRFPFEDIPCRVFLDTNVVNILVKWAAYVFEDEPLPARLDPTLESDIESLKCVFHIGTRANWDIVASAKTLSEMSDTPDKVLRKALLDYGALLVDGIENEDHRFAKDFARRLVESRFVADLPDSSDRELIAHAVALDCDVFCTCDRRSIHRKRDRLHSIPLRILTPAEWWQHIKPWAGLWL